MADDPFVDLSPDDSAWGHAFITDDGCFRLHYVRQGHGDPVVLLHGWPGFWYDWRRVIPQFATDADIIAPDLRGFGASDKPDLPSMEEYTRAAQAASILSIVQKLDLAPIVLVGYDVGAGVSQELVRLAPDQIRALVLGAPSYPGFGARRFEPDAQREFWYQHFHRLPMTDDLIGHDRETVRLYLGHFYDHWVGRKESVRPREFEYIVDTYAQPGAVRGSITWYRSGSSAILATPQAPLPPITHPSTILWGEEDPIFPVAWSDRLPEYFTDLTFHSLPGVGHFIPFEAPDDVLAAIRAALHE